MSETSFERARRLGEEAKRARQQRATGWWMDCNWSSSLTDDAPVANSPKPGVRRYIEEHGFASVRYHRRMANRLHYLRVSDLEWAVSRREIEMVCNYPQWNGPYRVEMLAKEFAMTMTRVEIALKRVGLYEEAVAVLDTSLIIKVRGDVTQPVTTSLMEVKNPHAV